MSYQQKPVNSQSYQRINAHQIERYQRINAHQLTNKRSPLYIDPVVTCRRKPLVGAAQSGDNSVTSLGVALLFACSHYYF